MKNFKIEVKWAFIFIGSLLLWTLLERLPGLPRLPLQIKCKNG